MEVPCLSGVTLTPPAPGVPPVAAPVGDPLFVGDMDKVTMTWRTRANCVFSVAEVYHLRGERGGIRSRSTKTQTCLQLPSGPQHVE